MENFNRSSFETAEFLLESTEAPKIKPGGSSSSNILNRYFEAATRDISILTTRTNSLALRAERFENCALQQAGAFLSILSGVSSRVDAASGYSQVLADMHSSFYIDGSNTATIHEVFGQATLPIRSSIDVLVQEDVYGQKYVATEVELSYANLGVSSPAAISNSLYQTDSEGIFMLRDEQTWLVATSGTSAINAFFKLKTPLQFRGLQPNVLELWPMPAFGTELIGVWYQKADDTIAGTWYSLDLSYLPRYSSATGTLTEFGPVRLHLPESIIISQLVIGINPKSSLYAGFKKISLLHNEYETSAVLAVQDPYSRTIDTSTIRGKDPSDLAQLTVTNSVNIATVNLTTTDSRVTPVITGVILAV